MSRPVLRALCFALLGCARPVSSPPRAAVVAEDAAAVANTSVAAPVPPSDPLPALFARWHPQQRRVHDAFDWGGGWYGALGAEVDHPVVLLASSTEPAPASGASHAAYYVEWLEGPIARSAALDVDGDGVPELLLWDPSGALRGYHRQGNSLHALQRPAWLLAGATDPEQVRARLPLLRGYNAPAEGVTLQQVVLSMHLATDAQLLALLAPAGVNVCVVHSGNYLPHLRRCRRVRGAQLTAAWLRTELLQYRAFADYEGQEYRVRDSTDGSYVAAPPECGAARGQSSCAANMGGPGLYVWVFEGSGASLRLRELSQDYFEST